MLLTLKVLQLPCVTEVPCVTRLPCVTELPCVTCRSPVYATFTEALDGAASIRAYDAQHRFCQLNEQQVALSQQAAFAGKPAITISS